MSNEFVMVPRAELVRLQENLDPHRGAVAWGIVCDLLEKPHQGEPVALPARKRVDPFCYDQGRNASVEGWNACLDETAKLGPLYTHSDPSDIRTTRQALESLKGEANDLRVQLAGRDALLREVLVGLWPSTPIAIKINATLSASAEPSAPAVHPVNMKTIMRAYEQVDHKALLHGTSNWCAAMATALRGVLCAEPGAPVERDEREEFEAAWSARIERLRIRERGNEFYRVQPNDLYRWSNVQDAWELWQARAALSASAETEVKS